MKGDQADQVRTGVAVSGPWAGIHRGMALAATGMVLAFVVFTVLNVEGASAVYAGIRLWIETSLSWYYMLALCGALLVCFYLMVSRHGRIRLGDDDSRPEFSTFSWLAMLFSAGLGIGLLFFSISEPMVYFDNVAAAGYPNNPHADHSGAVDMDQRRAVTALRVTYFHWGLHGWSVYVLVGLCLAYFGYRKKLPLCLRSAFHPLIGDRIYGPIGHAVDLLAVFGAVFGIATSLGLGVRQMATGLHLLFGIAPSLTLQVTLVIAISAIATLSAVLGVSRGIRVISEWNIYLSIFLLAFFLVLGPFDWLMATLVTSVGEYLWTLLPMGFWTASESGAAVWQGQWTMFYWGWWIAWAPFVGMFIARISRGRTIREFIMGAMLVPTAVAIVWIGLLGGNGLYLELNAAEGPGSAGIMEIARQGELEAVLYETIARVGGIGWLSWTTMALATFLLATWFITSSDSGTLVIATLLSLGDDHPPRRFRVAWGAAVAAVAAILLLLGGLEALQTASVAAALPVSFILMGMAVSVVKSLTQDPSAVPGPA